MEESPLPASEIPAFICIWCRLKVERLPTTLLFDLVFNEYAFVS